MFYFCTDYLVQTISELDQQIKEYSAQVGSQ